MSLRAGLRPTVPGLAPAPALGGSSKRRPLHDIRRGIARRRRLAAAVFAALAVIAGVRAVSPTPAKGTSVVAAAHDVPAGTALTTADLETLTLPARAVPDGAIRDVRAVVGLTTTGALRRGEPLTDVRIDDSPLRQPAPGLVAAPVRLADADAAALLQPGEHVDILAASTATTDTAEAASVIADDVRVLDVPQRSPAGATDPTLDGALVVLATTAAQARALAQAQVTARLSAVVVN